MVFNDFYIILSCISCKSIVMRAIIGVFLFGTMVINVAWNRRCGPGGGTRRLHQSLSFGRFWRGRNRIDVRNKEVLILPGMISPQRINKVNANKKAKAANDNIVVANDNYAPVAMAAAA